MVSLYEFMEVDENASKEEIEKAYKGFLLKYRVDPSQSEEQNKENEMIINKIKMAYDILTNDEKRAAYDKSLANKRTEELLKTVELPQKKDVVEESKQEKPVEKQPVQSSSTTTKTVTNTQTDPRQTQKPVATKTYEIEDDSYDNNRAAELTKEEQARIKKAAEEEFKINLQKAQKAEEEYNEAYNKAYNDYLRKMGYQVKEPWTWKRIKSVIITLVAVVITCFIMWMIPPVRNSLTDLYESNQIIKGVVDIFLAIFRAVFGIFKK